MNFTRMMMAGTAALVMSAAAAQAGQITQVFLVGGGTPAITTDLNNVAYTDSANGTNTLIALFNPAAIAAANPGMTVTLNDVMVNMATSVQTSGSLQNQASAAQSFSFELALLSFLSKGNTTGTGAAAQNVLANTYAKNGTVYGTAVKTADFGEQDYTNVASGASVNYPSPNSTAPVQLNTNSMTTYTAASDLAAFTGTGGFGLNLNTKSQQNTSGGGGNVAINLNTFAGGAFGITYDYTLTAVPPTTVPEPASMALLGAGLVSVGLLRRRKA